MMTFTGIKLIVVLSFSLIVSAQATESNEEELCLTVTNPSKFVGPPGPPGPQGDQGDQGTCTCSQEDIKNSLVRPGWYAPGNFYQYFLTSTSQSWEAGREICRSLGGDLAAVGMRDFAILKKLTDELTNDKTAWIGLHDLPLEGSFMWVDGITSTAANTRWATGEPNNDYNKEDCAHLNFEKHSLYTINDSSCSYSFPALCEMRLM